LGRSSLRESLRAAAWPICIFVAALIVRLHWNLVVHPLDEFLYSDMNGYVARADQALDDPLGQHEYAAFFPYGTTYLVALVKLVAGRDNGAALAVAWALIGAANVLCMVLVAQRIGAARWVAPVVGVIGICYYPLISIGGYVLSEAPSSLCLTLATLLLLRLVESGRRRDALLLGLVVGIGATFRPQIMVSGAAFGLFWLFARRHLPRVGFARLVEIGVPIALVLAYSAVRLHHHTGRWGLVSENGRINQVFGHCHNKGIYSMPDELGHGTVRFAPPALIQLERWSGENPDSWIQLDPIWGEDPTPVEGVPGFAIDSHGCRKRDCYVPGSEIQYSGYIGDEALQSVIVKECLRRTGLRRQVRYAATHLVMLWGYNSMWPDQANPKPRAQSQAWRWRVMSDRWKGWHNFLLMPFALAGLIWVFHPGRRLTSAIVALNFWALLAVTVLYLGGIRFRVPYDPVIIVLAVQSWALAAGVVVRWIRARRARRAGAQVAKISVIDSRI
jgi:hypothetical protein